MGLTQTTREAAQRLARRASPRQRHGAGRAKRHGEHHAWAARRVHRTPRKMRCGITGGFLLVVATMRGLTAPLPNGCDALLDRYGTECYLARRDVNEFGEVWFGGGEPAPGCSELRTTLDVRCVRWRGAKI